MLTLSRHQNERIVITLPSGEEVIIQVADIQPYRVKLGITAPRNVSIVRDEVVNRTAYEEAEDD